MSSEKIIKDAVKNGKLVIGKREVSRYLKNGKLAAVVYTENCPSDVLRDLGYYSRISKVPLEKFNGNSASLGQMCGKPFKIVTLGIEK